MSVADRLRGAREYLGLPPDYTAKESGLDADVIEGLERGEREPTDLELRRLGRVLGYPIAYFRGETSSLEPGELAAVARWAEELEEDDRRQALRFAEYLRFAALSEADAGS
jgi:transcriptional regulator with XRE-family HTH domain